MTLEGATSEQGAMAQALPIADRRESRQAALTLPDVKL
jgi:hypothetical protein